MHTLIMVHRCTVHGTAHGTAHVGTSHAVPGSPGVPHLHTFLLLRPAAGRAGIDARARLGTGGGVDGGRARARPQVSGGVQVGR